MTNDDKEILARLDVAAEAKSLGIRFSASEPNASGWQECYAIGRDENKPSAAIAVASENGVRGRYTDRGSGDRSISFFDLAAKLAPAQFPTWRDARDHFALKVGLAQRGSKTTRPKKPSRSKAAPIDDTSADITATPSAGNEGSAPRDLLKKVRRPSKGGPDDMLAKVFTTQWAEKKTGVNVGAALSAGAFTCEWPAKSRISCIAFAGRRSAFDVEPWAVLLFRVDGQNFAAFKSLPERRHHLVRGSTDSLIIAGGWERLVEAEVVWKFEGPAHLLAWASHLPAGHVGITNVCGAGSWPSELSTPLLRKVIHVVGDADKAGEGGARNVVAEVFATAKLVKHVRLPYEIVDNHGKDARDFFNEGHTIADLMALAESAPVETADTAGKPREKKPAKCDLPRFANFDVVPGDGDDGKPVYLPRTLPTIIDEIRRLIGDWPRRVGEALFAPNVSEQVDWLGSVAATFGYLQSRLQIFWRSGSGFVTKEETVAEIRRTATPHVAVEVLPHEPPLAGHFYCGGEVASGDGRQLQTLLDKFNPATDVDRDLMQAAMMTLFWGGAGGTRPAFLVTGPDGRGSGKSKTAAMLSQLAGGLMEFGGREEIDRVKTRLLSAEGLTKRGAILDNIKSLKFSWAELEGLITSPVISGKRMYVGEASRPNTITWFITLNGPSLSSDMAQRVIAIHVLWPVYSGTWEDDTRAFIEEHRAAIIADVIAALRCPPRPPRRFMRWGSWENAILARLPSPEEAQRIIAERQAELDADSEEANTIEDFFADQLRRLGYDVDRDEVHVPVEVAARWLNWATGETHKTTGASRALRQMASEGKVTRILPNPSKANGRGFLWRGQYVDVGALPRYDLLEKLAKRKRDDDGNNAA